jgi:predicted transcriptional regulator
MGQTEIVEFLKKNQGTPFTEREINSELNKSTCRNSLKSLRKYPPGGFEFKRERQSNNVWAYIYRWVK